MHKNRIEFLWYHFVYIKNESIDENAAAINLQLTPAQLEQLNRFAPAGLAVGKTLLPD